MTIPILEARYQNLPMAFNQQFYLQNFDASVFVQGSYGAKCLTLKWQLESMNNAYNNQLRDVLDRYTASNTAANCHASPISTQTTGQ